MSEIVIESLAGCAAVVLVMAFVSSDGVDNHLKRDRELGICPETARRLAARAVVAVPYAAAMFVPLPFIAFVLAVWLACTASSTLAHGFKHWLWLPGNLLAVFLILSHAALTSVAGLVLAAPLRATVLDPYVRCGVLAGSLLISIVFGFVLNRSTQSTGSRDEAFGKSLKPLLWFSWFSLAYLAFDALSNDLRPDLANLYLFVLASEILLGAGLTAFVWSSSHLGLEAFQEEQYLRLAEEARAEEARKEELRRRAYTDALTGLAARRSALELIQRLLDEGRPFSLAFIDMNDFKAINDTYGHLQGDASLMRVARALRDEFGEQATICRMGGDEFLAVLEDCGTDEAERCAERALAAVSTPDGQGGPALSFSCGVLDSSSSDCLPSALIQMADNIMYERKNAYHRSKEPSDDRLGRRRSETAGAALDTPREG